MRIFSLLLLVLPGFAVADDAVTNFTLDNGMEVVVIEDHRAPVVVHMVWYRTGSADEPPGVSGVAHFLEHLMFNETANLARGELSATVAANGGSDNAFTSYDYTAYFQRVSADLLPLMMSMEAERMVNLRLQPDDVEVERLVVIEERAQRTDTSPGALFAEQRRAAQYINHRYGIPIIGWRHEIDVLTLADMQAHYEQYYAPNNAVLVVAGDVTPEEVRRLAEEYYGVIPANEALTPRDRPQEPPQLAERRVMFEDPRVSQPILARTYLAPERDSGAQEEAAALTILSALLGGSSFTSVLNDKLQFQENIAVYTNAGYRGMSLDDTTFSVFIVPTPGVSLTEAEAALDRVIAEFLEEGVDEAALERIKMQLRAAQIYARDDVGSVANRYGAAMTQGLTVADVQAWPDILQAVTAEDVMAAAERLFNDRNSVTGWMAADLEAAQ